MDTSESKSIHKRHLTATIGNNCSSDSWLVSAGTNAVTVQRLILCTRRHVDDTQLTVASIATQRDLHSSTASFPHTHTDTRTHTLSHNITQHLQIQPQIQKIPDFSRTSQDPRTFFQDVVAAQQYWNIKVNGSYLLKIYNVSGSIIHGHIAKRSSQVKKKALGVPLSRNTLCVYLHMLFYKRHYA